MKEVGTTWASVKEGSRRYTFYTYSTSEKSGCKASSRTINNAIVRGNNLPKLIL